MRLKIGTKYNRLLILAYLEKAGPRNKSIYRCLCDCGVEKTVERFDLINGKITSCGCAHRERARELNKIHCYTHGQAHTRAYKTWLSMKARCLVKTHIAYDRYGGRGIKICSKWANSFEAFYKDMGQPGTGQSIERKANNGHYEPGNCRWATAKEQAGNRCNNYHITWQGRTQILSKWAEETGLNGTVISNRIKKGWTIEDALTTPPFSTAEATLFRYGKFTQAKKRELT